MADVAGGCRACHAELEDGCLGGVGGRGVRLEREAPTTVALAQVEVQDAGLAHAGPACELYYRPYLVSIGDRDEHSLVQGRRRGLQAGLQYFVVRRHLDRHEELLTRAARRRQCQGVHGRNTKAYELDSKLPCSNAV